MLEVLEPKSVFYYFEQICNIPHGSGHVEKISNYLMEFAREHHLKARQDALYNVIIWKEASRGKESCEPVMIQGHMDMVAVKDPGETIDLLKDPLKLRVDGDYVYAKGTSLGGDDGIAVAFGLAILASETIEHPPIELVVTTEEEVGMEGATGIDLSDCKAQRMLNLDSEDEGEFVVACAGGIRVNGFFETETELAEGNIISLELSGITGGHSGTEIDKNGANAIMELAKILDTLYQRLDPSYENIKIIDLSGGLKDNAIPISARATMLVTREEFLKQVISMASELEGQWQNRWSTTDPELKLSCRELSGEEPTEKGTTEMEATKEEPMKKESVSVWKVQTTQKLLKFLCNVPNGVLAMSQKLPGLVETSLNLGIMECEHGSFHLAFSLRSSVAEAKDALRDKISGLIRESGGTVTLTGDYPAWEYRENSPLRDQLVAIFTEQYGHEPKVLSLHAGLECGILAAKKKGLDCVSFGPDILDIHTTAERLRISSVERTWKFTLEVLKAL